MPDRLRVNKNLVADRLRVNKLVLKFASWVASATQRRVELWDDTLVIPPALAARAAVLAFGDELIDLKLRPDKSGSQWRSPGGRDMAAAYLLPRAEAALRQKLQRLADAVKRARAGESSSSSGSRTWAAVSHDVGSKTAGQCSDKVKSEVAAGRMQELTRAQEMVRARQLTARYLAAGLRKLDHVRLGPPVSVLGEAGPVDLHDEGFVDALAHQLATLNPNFV